MPDHIDNLKHIVGESNAFDHQDDIHPFLEDWRGQVKGATPLILFPLGTEHVKNIVQYCNENNIKIVSQGGNTSLCGANVPNSSEQNIEIVINTSKMNKVIEVDPFNRSMIVESGCILQNIQSIAQDHDLLFPLSLSAEGSCQIGGNISTNAGGVNVLKYGMARDQVMGIEVVLPDGSIFSDLKSLRKNNTGYDLKQLFIGAEGTLGVITKVSLKLSSSPINEITSMVSLNNIDDAIALLKESKKKFGDNITAFEFISRSCLVAIRDFLGHIKLPLGSDESWQIIFEVINHDEDSLLGFLEDQVNNGIICDGLIAKNEKERKDFWLVRHSISEAEKLSGRGAHHDISLPIINIPEFLEKTIHAMEEIAGKSTVYTFGHLGDGNLHFTKRQPDDLNEDDFINFSNKINAVVHENAEALGGSFSAEHGIGSKLKNDLLKFSDPIKIELMKKVKNSLDPKNIMNPNKLIEP
jgi:FAD/FMN-containing dehydrogenase